MIAVGRYLVVSVIFVAACGDQSTSPPSMAMDASLDTGAVATGDASVPDGGVAMDAAADTTVDAPQDANEAGASTQHIGIPMYVDPSAPDWPQAIGAAPTVAMLIANPNSGPGTVAQASYTQAIASAQTAGQTVVGYVHTSYGARPIADVKSDVDSWYAFYPAIDGIFVDETPTDAAKIAAYYSPLYAYVKAKSGRHLVIINPGTPPDEQYMAVSDVVMSYEDTYANYVNALTPAWVSHYPRTRFWHIVLSATQAEIANTVMLSRQRNAGIVFVTDQGPNTAYSQIVTGVYWKAEVAAVSAP